MAILIIIGSVVLVLAGILTLIGLWINNFDKPRGAK